MSRKAFFVKSIKDKNFNSYPLKFATFMTSTWLSRVVFNGDFIFLSLDEGFSCDFFLTGPVILVCLMSGTPLLPVLKVL